MEKGEGCGVLCCVASRERVTAGIWSVSDCAGNQQERDQTAGRPRCYLCL